ncbi:MAG: carboxypeptidase regulatory-like domain-containing protein [Phycisphaerae bacterium]
MRKTMLILRSQRLKAHAPFSTDVYRRLLLANVLVAIAALAIASPRAAGFSPRGHADATDRGAPTTRSTDDIRADKSSAPKTHPDRQESAQKQRHIFAEGQVVDPIGRGAAGVKIEARRAAPPGEPKNAKGRLLAATTTDSLGDFTLAADHAIRGEIVVSVVKEGFEPDERRFTAGDDDWPAFLDIQLGGTLVLTGTVLDAIKNHPIPAATVTVSMLFDERLATTDEQGRFRFDRLTPGALELMVTADGFGRERAKITVPTGDKPCSVGLKPERIVRFKVVDEIGQPIPGTILECLDPPREDFRSVITDDEGRAVLRGLHFDADSLDCRVTEDQHVSSMELDTHVAMPADSAESEHTLVLQRAGSISGTVTAGSLGEPVSGARLFTGSEYGDTSPREWTDFQGACKIIGIAPGKTLVTVHAAGYAPQLHEVEVTVGQSARLDVRLKKGHVFSGVIKDASGRPAVGAIVSTTQWRGARTLGLRAMTRPDGSFVIADVPPDEFDVSIVGPNREHAAATYRPDSDEPFLVTLPEAKAPKMPGRPPTLKAGQSAPLFEATTLAGTKLDLKSLRGKVVLLDFWATWCGPCVAELPLVVATHEAFGARDDFVVIGISLDFDKNTLAKFVNSRKLPWHQVYGDPASAVAERYGVVGIPAMFLIDRKGNILESDLHGAGIKASVEKALKEASAP